MPFCLNWEQAFLFQANIIFKIYVSDILQLKISITLNVKSLQTRYILQLPPFSCFFTDELTFCAGNPLRCGCDIWWLFGSASFYNRFTETTLCSDGYPLYDIVPEVFPVHCDWTTSCQIQWIIRWLKLLDVFCTLLSVLHLNNSCLCN